MSSPLDMLQDPDFGFKKRGQTPWIPILLAIAVVVGGVWFLLPGSVSMEDCGDLSEHFKMPKAERPKLYHDQFCTLTGVVANTKKVTVGNIDLQGKTVADKYRAVRVFARLESRPTVVAVLPMGGTQVFKWFARRDSLLGYTVDGTGRLFDPDKEKGYALFANAVRKGLGLGDKPFLIFDMQVELPK